MKPATMIRMFLLGLALTASTQTFAYAASPCVPNPDPICPRIYEPVTCSNGVTYSNQCYADAACAKGCHRA